MAGIREANRRLGTVERIEGIKVVSMFEVENAEEGSKLPIRRRHNIGKPKNHLNQRFIHAMKRMIYRGSLGTRDVLSNPFRNADFGCPLSSWTDLPSLLFVARYAWNLDTESRSVDRV